MKGLLLILLIQSTNAGLLDWMGLTQPPQAPQRFSFGHNFIGEWSVTRRDQSMIEGTDRQDGDGDLQATYTILSENYTTALVGDYSDMDNEVNHLVRIEFDDDSLNTGKFFTAAPSQDSESEWLEEGDDESLLFDFDFSDMGAPLHHSAGIWRSQTTTSGWYNFVFYGTDTFVLNVVPHTSQGDAFFIRGTKVRTSTPKVEQPWYSRFMLPLSMFFLLRRFLPGVGGEEPARAAAPPAAAAPAAK